MAHELPLEEMALSEIPPDGTPATPPGAPDLPPPPATPSAPPPDGASGPTGAGAPRAADAAADSAADAAGSPQSAASPGADEPRPGLIGQAKRTRAAAERLLTAHIELARTEVGEIVERAKVAAALVAVAIGLLIFIALLVPVGTTLFVGEWLFGSIGWGVLHGLLFSIALIVSLLLGALEVPSRRVATAFLAALGLGLVVGTVLAFSWPNQLYWQVGNSVIPGVDAGVRPLIVGMVGGAVVIGLLGMLAGLRAGGGSGLVAGLVVSVPFGIVLGAFTAIAFGPRAGAALGVCVWLIAWPAFAALALRDYDFEALKRRYWPTATIETTKETIEWVRERTPLGKKS